MQFAACITTRTVATGEVTDLDGFEFATWDQVVTATTAATKRLLNADTEVYVIIAKEGDPWNLLRTARMDNGKVVLDQGWC